MNLKDTMFTIFEIALVGFAIWSVFHEDVFVAFEEKIVERVRRRRFKVIHGNNVCKTCCPEKHRA